MKNLSIRIIAIAVVTLSIATQTASAKDPRALAAPALFSTPIQATHSLTPPPKEWAMFPQDEPPPVAPQNGQIPNPPNNAAAPGSANANGSTANGSVVSVAHSHTPRQRELPLFWLIVTGALSLGAFAAGGSLILRKDADDDIPVVSELQEIAA